MVSVPTTPSWPARRRVRGLAITPFRYGARIRRRPLLSLFTLLLTLLAAVVTAVAVPAQVDAAEGYTLESETVYRVEPAVPAVRVEAAYRMTNTSPDIDLGGGRIRYFFYDGVTLPIEANATDVSVEVNGRAAQFEVVEDIDSFRWLEIAFTDDLQYGDTATVDLRYSLLGDPPRTERSFTRVNPAYVSFPVLAFGDDGGANVSVVIPEDWTPDQVGDEMRVRAEAGTLIYEANEIESPLNFFALFTARQDESLDSKPIKVGDSLFELRAWPGDIEWRDFAERQITEGVPVLERLTGSPWPETAETDVIEASTPYLRGYAGYYYADDDVIEIGEELDSHTMLHELSHAWFNNSAIAERWLSEGLADEIASRTVAALGGELPRPDDLEIDDSVNRTTFRLNSWSSPSGDEADATEAYGYRQAFTVLRALSEEIGDAQMTALVGAVIRGDRAYPAEDGTTASTGTVDWRKFLDLAEQVGGSQQIVDLYRDHVVTPQQVDELDARLAALEQYDALVARGAGWWAPVPVRTNMAQWEFDAAIADIEAAHAALDFRDRLVDELAPLGLAPIADLEDHYERVDDLAVVTGELEQHAAAAGELAEARQALLQRLDLIGQDVPALTQHEYARDPIAVADSTSALAMQAGELAAARSALDATLAEWDLSVPALDRGAFVASPESAIAKIADYQRAADAIVAAHERSVREPSFVERIGEIGITADTLLARADARLAAGDVDGAIEAAEHARRAYDNWEDRGQERLQTAGIAYAGVLLLVVVGLLVFGRGRSPQRDMEAAAADGQTWPDAIAGDAADPADAGEVVAVDSDR